MGDPVDAIEASSQYLADSDRCHLASLPDNEDLCLFQRACIEVQKAFIAGWQAHAAQPVSEAAVEAGLEALMRYGDEEVPRHFAIIGDNPHAAMRRAIEAARRADANTTEGEKA